MRWRRVQFALFAVAVLATAVFGVAPRAASAAGIKTSTVLLWRGQTGQPKGKTTFFVRVTREDASGSLRPNGSVTVSLDGVAPKTYALKDDPDSNHKLSSITDDFVYDLGTNPHYLLTKYAGNESFASSDDELGLGTGTVTASPEPSNQSEIVKYTFTFNVSASTPGNRRPVGGTVRFADDNGHSKETTLDDSLKARWDVGQSPGTRITTAHYEPGGDEIFLPVTVTYYHGVNPAPGATTTPPQTTPGRVPTTARRSGTTVALAPINPSTSTSISSRQTTTSNDEPPEAFGDFTTNTTASGGLAASESNKSNDDGPPLVVVVSTLGALSLLGGVAAVRRYRRSSIDWF